MMKRSGNIFTEKKRVTDGNDLLPTSTKKAYVFFKGKLALEESMRLCSISAAVIGMLKQG